MKGAKFELAIFQLNPGVQAADLIIRATEGDLHYIDAVVLIPLLGKLPEGVNRIAVISKGEVKFIKKAEIESAAVKASKAAPKSGTKVILASPAGTQTAPAKLVRELKPGEKITDLVNEGKAITWTEGVESAVVSVENRAGKARRIVVTGGRDGIEFIERDGKLFMQIEGQEVQVKRVIGHTHPVATGPSQGDLDY